MAVLALGIWMKVELYLYMELTDVYYSEAPYVLIGVGAGIIIIGSLGCCCTVKGTPFLLYVVRDNVGRIGVGVGRGQLRFGVGGREKGRWGKMGCMGYERRMGVCE